MSDFQDDPSQGQRRIHSGISNVEIETPLESPLKDTLGVKTSRMSILGEMHGKSDAIAPQLSLSPETIDSLHSSIKKINIFDLNEDARNLLYEEIKEACAHLLSKMMSTHELKLESLSNLTDVLSDPELQALLDTFGSFSLGILGADILKALPEIDRFEGAAYLETIIAPEKSYKEILSESFVKDSYPHDPISRFLFNLEADIKEALGDIDEFFAHYWNGKRRKAFTSSMQKAQYLKEKAIKIKKKKKRAKESASLLLSFAIFSLLLFIFRVFEVPHLGAFILSFIAAFVGYILKNRP